MNRLPIRVRLTLAFALAMAAVLAATGAFLYLRLGSSLDETIDEGLRARLADVSALAARADPGLGEGARGLADPEESFAQVLDPAGRVVDSSPGGGGRPVLEPDELARLEPQSVLRFEREEVPGIEGRARLLATAVEGRRVVVVGSSLGDRREALHGLLFQLLVVGPAALLLASLLGYGLATGALRPVDSLRAEAASISGDEPGHRLTAPAARDEIARLADTLNAMLGRLEQARARERRFVADASHELRTPLSRLKGELELALRRPRSTDELEQALRSAAVETDRLAQLAEGLLVLARSDEGRLPLSLTTLPARVVLERVAERFGRIEIKVPDGLRVRADELRLEQALGNLVANALEHGESPVKLEAREQDGSVELHVLDSGPGFPPAFLPHVFERFRRADEARSGGGAGLGLAIADVIARAHGGSAHAANRDGPGADVWLSIPNA